MLNLGTVSYIYRDRDTADKKFKARILPNQHLQDLDSGIIYHNVFNWLSGNGITRLLRAKGIKFEPPSVILLDENQSPERFMTENYKR